MSELVQLVQIERKYQTGAQVAQAFTTTAGSTNEITTVLTALSTADNVPLQIAVKTLGSEVMGYVLNENISIWNSSSKEAFTDGAGNEVYGKITKAGTPYLLEYFSIVDGVETAYTMGAGNIIDFEAHYFFNDLKLPNDILVRTNKIRVGEDPNSAYKQYSEIVSVTALNTLANLTKDPVASTPVILYINNIPYTLVSGAFTLAGKVITWVWNASNGGFDIQTTYTVTTQYTVKS